MLAFEQARLVPFAQTEDAISVTKQGRLIGRFTTSLGGLSLVAPDTAKPSAKDSRFGLLASGGRTRLLYADRGSNSELTLRPSLIAGGLATRLSERTSIGVGAAAMHLPGHGFSDALSGLVAEFPGRPSLRTAYRQSLWAAEVENMGPSRRLRVGIGRCQDLTSAKVFDADDSVVVPFPTSGWDYWAAHEQYLSDGDRICLDLALADRKGRAAARASDTDPIGNTAAYLHSWRVAATASRRRPDGCLTTSTIEAFRSSAAGVGMLDIGWLGGTIPAGVGFDIFGRAEAFGIQAGTEQPSGKRGRVRVGAKLISARAVAGLRYHPTIAVGIVGPTREIRYDFRKLVALFIGLGYAERTKRGSIEYSLGQLIPLAAEQVSEPIVGPTPPGVVRPPRRTRGGTVHTLAIVTEL